MNLFQHISDKMIASLSGRFKPYEVRTSITQIAIRWKFVLSEDERRKVARTLGGNRYAKSAYELLDTVFGEVVDEHKS